MEHGIHKPALPTYIFSRKTDYDIFHSYQSTATAHTIKAKRTIIQIKLYVYIVEIGHKEGMRTTDACISLLFCIHCIIIVIIMGFMNEWWKRTNFHSFILFAYLHWFGLSHFNVEGKQQICVHVKRKQHGRNAYARIRGHSTSEFFDGVTCVWLRLYQSETTEYKWWMAWWRGIELTFVSFWRILTITKKVKCDAPSNLTRSFTCCAPWQCDVHCRWTELEC